MITVYERDCRRLGLLFLACLPYINSMGRIAERLIAIAEDKDKIKRHIWKFEKENDLDETIIFQKENKKCPELTILEQ